MSFKAVFLLCLGLSAAAGEQKELSGVVGGNITLPDSILDKGFLYHNGSHIASLIKGTFEPIAKNVHWKNGLFTITDLQRNDSGVYKLESNMGSVFNFSYWLRVFDPVPTPEVSRLNTNVTTPGDLNQTESGIKETKRHHYWIMPPVAGILVAVVLLYILFKCCKKKMTNGQTQAVSVGSNSKFRSLTRVRLETVLLVLKRWSSDDAGPAWETKLPQLTSQDSLLTSVVTK